MTAQPTYTAADVAAMPTPALLALYNQVTGKQTKKFASRADAERQTIRVLSSAGRIVDESEAPAEGQPTAPPVRAGGASRLACAVRAVASLARRSCRRLSAGRWSRRSSPRFRFTSRRGQKASI